jgi:hypothetical protein
MNISYIQIIQFKCKDVEALKTLNSLAPFAHLINSHMKSLPYLLVGVWPFKTCENWLNNTTTIEVELVAIPYTSKKKMLSLGILENYKSL